MNWYRTMTAATSGALLAVLTACGSAAPAANETTSSTAPSAAASAAPSVAASVAASAAAESPASSAAADTASSDIPLYTGATPLDPNSPMATALSGVKQQLEQQSGDASVSVDLYNLPSGTTFEQVRQFYNDALTADGWTDATGQAQMPEMQGGGSAAWARNANEAVAVLVLPNPLSEGNSMLVVSHATPR
jgi:hypothetical protein